MDMDCLMRDLGFSGCSSGGLLLWAGVSAAQRLPKPLQYSNFGE
jgi:hypothetical protein